MKKLYCLALIIILVIPIYSRDIRFREMERQKDASFPTLELDAPPLMINGYMGDPLKNCPAGFFGIIEDRRGRDVFETNLYLIQFSERFGPDVKNTLESMNMKVHAYYPMFTFLVEDTQGRSLNTLRANIPQKIRWMGKYYPEYRYPRGLLTTTQQLDTEKNPYYLLLTSPLPGTYEDIYIQEMPDGLYMAKYNLYPHELKEIIALPNMLYVHASVPLQIMNNQARGIMESSFYWNERYRTPHIIPMPDEEPDLVLEYMEGAKVTFAVSDTGLDSGDVDGFVSEEFLRYTVDPEADFPHLREVGTRVLSIFDIAGDNDRSDVHGHGTHCAGSILANAYHTGLYGDLFLNRLIWGGFAGSAPEGNLIFLAASHNHREDLPPGNLHGLDINLPASLLHPDNDIVDIYSHSWGSVDPFLGYGGYCSVARFFDTVLWNDVGADGNPRKLVFQAAGNDGQDRNLDGIINRDSLSTTATAKNIVTVGASENSRPLYPENPFYTRYKDMDVESFPSNPIHDDNIANDPRGLAAFSSRGPTQDFRIKPDIVAPGTNVVSVLSSDSDLPNFFDRGGIYNEAYTIMSGTSMATPLAAGAAGVLKEYTSDRIRRPIAQIPSYALKAILLTATEEMYPGQYDEDEYPDIDIEKPEYGPGDPVPLNPDYPFRPRKEIAFVAPNTDEGWGRLNVNNFLRRSPEIVDILYTTEQNGIQWRETLSYTFNVKEVRDPIENRYFPIKALLTWHDYPSMPGTGGLVNDIDMMMIGPDGTEYFPNQYLDDTAYFDILTRQNRKSFSNHTGEYDDYIDKSWIDGYAFEVKFEKYPVTLTELFLGLRCILCPLDPTKVRTTISIFEGTDVNPTNRKIYEDQHYFNRAVGRSLYRYSLTDPVVLYDDVLVKINVNPLEFAGWKNENYKKTEKYNSYTVHNNYYTPIEDGNFMAEAVGWYANIHKEGNYIGDNYEEEFVEGFYASIEVPDYPAYIKNISLGLRTNFGADEREELTLRIFEGVNSPIDANGDPVNLVQPVMDYTYEIPAQAGSGMVKFRLPRSIKISEDSLLEVTFRDDSTEALIDIDMDGNDLNTWRLLSSGDIVKEDGGNFMVGYHVSYFVSRTVEKIDRRHCPLEDIVIERMGWDDIDPVSHGFIQYYEPEYEGYIPSSFEVHEIAFPLQFNPHYFDGARPDADIELRVYEEPVITNGDLTSPGTKLHTYDLSIPHPGHFNDFWYEFTFPDRIEIDTGRVLFQVVFNDYWDPDINDSLLHIYRNDLETPMGVSWIGTEVDGDGELINLQDKGPIVMEMDYSFEIPRAVGYSEFDSDKFNNVKGIHLPQPRKTGNYTIKLHGYNIPFGKGEDDGLPFALAISYNAGDVPGFEDPIVEPPVGDDPDEPDVPSDDGKTFVPYWTIFD